MKKSFASCLLALALTVSAAAQQQQPSTRAVPNVPVRQIELTVKVTNEMDRPLTSPIRIQLLNGMGIPVSETYSRDGEARFPGISPGSYRLRASAPDIEDTQTESAFTITQWDSVHYEFLRCKRKFNPGEEQQSAEGYVSAAMLNIPGKAKKEFDKGLDALDKKDYVEAQKRFDKASSLYPRYAAAFNNLGFVAMQTGDPNAGEAYFQRAIEADDQYPGGYLNLARVRWGQKRFADAEKLLLKNSTLDPKNVEAISLLANLNAMSGRYDEAINFARKAHTMPHEGFTVVHYIAGMAFQAKNQFADAAVEYRQYLKETPQGKSADNARNALANCEQKLATK